jgi:hypothetical protein
MRIIRTLDKEYYSTVLRLFLQPILHTHQSRP